MVVQIKTQYWDGFINQRLFIVPALLTLKS